MDPDGIVLDIVFLIEFLNLSGLLFNRIIEKFDCRKEALCRTAVFKSFGNVHALDLIQKIRDDHFRLRRDCLFFIILIPLVQALPLPLQGHLLRRQVEVKDCIEFLPVHRLFQIVRKAGRKDFPAEGLRDVIIEQDDRGRNPPAQLGLDGVEDGKAVGFRHQIVYENNIIVVLFQLGNEVFRILHQDRIEARVFQHMLQVFPLNAVVIYDQGAALVHYNPFFHGSGPPHGIHLHEAVPEAGMKGRRGRLHLGMDDGK